jgi:hypothetical protein
LTEQLDSAVNEIHIMPGFGNRLTVLLYKGDGIPEPMQGAVSSVTVYGDGRISYEPIEDAVVAS